MSSNLSSRTDNSPLTPQEEARAATLKYLRDACVVGVVRTRTIEQARSAANALMEGGVSAIEITLTIPAATALVAELAAGIGRQEKIVIGAGTVLTTEDAQAALAAGAEFLVSPVAPPGLAELAHQRGVPMVLGGLTPTEILTALGLGADMVKVYPVASLGGPPYIRMLQGPFPGLPLMVSGGTILGDLVTYRALGVQTVAFTDALLPRDLVEQGKWNEITGLARQAMQLLANA